MKKKQWNRHHSAMLLLDMFPEWLVGSPLFHIVHILGTSLEYVFACFSGIFGFNLETADHAFNLIAQSCPPTHSKLASIACETRLPFAMLLLALAWHGATQLLPQPFSSSLGHCHRDIGPPQLLSADIFELLGQCTPRRWWDDENSFPDFCASLLSPIPAALTGPNWS